MPKPDQDKRTTPERSIEADLPIMKERARDHVHLMFLVDVFQRALDHNMKIVSGTVNRFSGKLSEKDREKLEYKLSADMLMLLEMARNLSSRGKALLEQANKVIEKIPYWDQV